MLNKQNMSIVGSIIVLLTEKHGFSLEKVQEIQTTCNTTCVIYDFGMIEIRYVKHDLIYIIEEPLVIIKSEGLGTMSRALDEIKKHHEK